MNDLKNNRLSILTCCCHYYLNINFTNTIIFFLIGEAKNLQGRNGSNGQTGYRDVYCTIALDQVIKLVGKFTNNLLIEIKFSLIVRKRSLERQR